jgi:hypothetical protein
MIFPRSNCPHTILVVSTIWMLSIVVMMNSCKHSQSVLGEYYDRTQSEILNDKPLFAVTNEEYLQIGSSVAYISSTGDTVIPFGKYLYFGTDTLTHFAKLIL